MNFDNLEEDNNNYNNKNFVDIDGEKVSLSMLIQTYKKYKNCKIIYVNNKEDNLKFIREIKSGVSKLVEKVAKNLATISYDFPESDSDDERERQEMKEKEKKYLTIKIPYMLNISSIDKEIDMLKKKTLSP